MPFEVSTCRAPCTLTLAPGRYRVELADARADDAVTRAARGLSLGPGDTRVRVRRREGLRASAIVSLATGVIAAIVGGLLVVGSGGECGTISGSECDVGAYAAGLIALGAGALGVGTGGVLLSVSTPRVEVVRRVPSIAIAPTAGGAAAVVAWRF